MPGHLIIGGARSGKSAYAEKLARATGLPIVYVATAEARDDEMRRRVDKHREARPASWRTVEAGIAIAPALEKEGQAGVCVIVDCITLWLARLLAPNPDADAPSAVFISRMQAQRERLVAALAASAAQILVVSNELGSGVTPLGPLSRAFVDEHGITNQRIAAVCDRVTLMVAGCALEVKPGASR